MSDCTIYIDESGDLGIGKGTRWFVLSAVVVKKTDETIIRSKMNQIKSKLNIKTIHMKKLPNFRKRAYIVRELNETSFTYMNVLVDTQKLDITRISSTSVLYNHCCKYLLQCVSKYLKANGLTADIVLSARGTPKDGELITYIKDKLFPYPNNSIDASSFDKVSAIQAQARDLLQLADVCATTTYLSLQTDEYGFVFPCFSMALSDHLFRKNNKLENYGVKYYKADMKSDKAERVQYRPCSKGKTKERTPGVTTT